MRKILITLAVLVAVVIVFLATWIFYGYQISLFLDRFGTIEVTSTRINSIAYQGDGTGGIFHVNDLELSLNDRNGPAPSIGTTKNDPLALADRGRFLLSVRCGQKQRTSPRCRRRAMMLR